MVVCINGCASSLYTPMFYIRESRGHAKIRDTLNDLVKLCVKYLTINQVQYTMYNKVITFNAFIADTNIHKEALRLSIFDF